MIDRPTASLIRQYVDGELPAEQTAHLQQQMDSDPELREAVQSQLRFERLLRQRIAAVMGTQAPATPPDMVDRIKAIWAADDALNAAAPVSEPAPVLPASNERRPSGWGGGGLNRLFVGPQRANIFAVAATLAIITSAVLWGIFGRSIDDFAPVQQTDLVTEVAEFADQEHERLAHDQQRLRERAEYLDTADAQLKLSEWLGVPVEPFDLSELGYVFAGAGRCDMPVKEPSGYFLYRKVSNGEMRPMVSIFVAPNLGYCRKMCRENKGKGSCRWEALDERSGASKCKRKVLCATDGNVVYLLVCCDKRDAAALSELIAAALDRFTGDPPLNSN